MPGCNKSQKPEAIIIIAMWPGPSLLLLYFEVSVHPSFFFLKSKSRCKEVISNTDCIVKCRDFGHRELRFEFSYSMSVTCDLYNGDNQV